MTRFEDEIVLTRELLEKAIAKAKVDMEFELRNPCGSPVRPQQKHVDELVEQSWTMVQLLSTCLSVKTSRRYARSR